MESRFFGELGGGSVLRIDVAFSNYSKNRVGKAEFKEINSFGVDFVFFLLLSLFGFGLFFSFVLRRYMGV